MKQTESVDDYKKVIAVSKEKVEYLAKITSDLLTLYRKTHAVHNQRFDLSKLLCEITEEYTSLTQDRHISLRLTLVCLLTFFSGLYIFNVPFPEEIREAKEQAELEKQIAQSVLK